MPDNFGPEKNASSWRDLFRQLENGPERYAPPHPRPPETPDQGVKNVVTLLAKQQPEAPAESAEQLNEIIRHIATDSVENIDRVIFDLKSVRDVLRDEGVRISREVNDYASLNQAAAAAMKVIAENLKQWKERPSQK
jgi:hypothetical protein